MRDDKIARLRDWEETDISSTFKVSVASKANTNKIKI